MAQAMPIKTRFTASRLGMARQELRRLAAFTKEARRVSTVLAKYGIRFIVVEPLPGIRVDGVAFWLNDESPVIGVSLRFDRIDAFWYTLMHEFSHIYHGDALSVDTELVGGDDSDEQPVLLKDEMGMYLTQVTTRCRIGEMEDYPRNLAEFEARFATEQACREYLCQLRWPEGFRCPRCGHDKAWAVRTALLECAGCGHQASPTAGIIFQDTRQPLQSWFRAMWWLTSQKNGASALGLQRVLGLGSYKTAWTWLHKLRRAMVRPGRDRLSGRVEVDETYLGGLEEGVRGRQTDAKALIVVAAEEDGAGIGRVRIRTIPNASGDSLMAFVGESIEPGSVVHTDGWLGYEPLEGDGYRHEVSYLEGQPARASKLLPRVHRVVSLVKRWILGTHQGAVSHEHLDSYLDEFAFRFNRRKSRSRGKLFYRLVQQAVAVPPAPYKSLVGGTATRATDDHNM